MHWLLQALLFFKQDTFDTATVWQKHNTPKISSACSKPDTAGTTERLIQNGKYSWCTSSQEISSKANQLRSRTGGNSLGNCEQASLWFNSLEFLYLLMDKDTHYKPSWQLFTTSSPETAVEKIPPKKSWTFFYTYTSWWQMVPSSLHYAHWM